jgi:protein arginine kinase activator
MLCDICKTNEATVHLTQIVDGEVRKVDLCAACAKAKNLTEHPDFSLADVMLGLGAAEGIKASSADGQCPACGLTLADFKKTGRLGCGECWATFEKGLSSLLRDMHRGAKHVGKVPKRSLQAKEVGERLQSLEQQLKQAIQEERFEDAATLRDQIRQLEAKAKPTAG